MGAVVDLRSVCNRRWATLPPVSGPCVAVTSSGERYDVVNLQGAHSALCIRNGIMQSMPLTMLRATK